MRSRKPTSIMSKINMTSLKPFLKWAGGKRQLLPVLSQYVPVRYNRYYEPFVGAGALFFQQQPKAGLINDINWELFNCYRVIRDYPESLIERCQYHAANHSKEYYYYYRNLDRDPYYFSDNQDLVGIAARTIYLNKTCFNGLYRVNKKGQFNTPYGKYKDPKVINSELILEISSYLRNNDIEITCRDFERAVADVSKGDFVYIDPPYYPLTETSNFTSYSSEGFDKKDQERLKQVCDYLRDEDCSILISNSNTSFIRGLYSDYEMEAIEASRAINSKGNKRGNVGELLIYYYSTEQNLF